MRTITSVGVIITAMLLMAVTRSGAAHAQYPQPSGSVAVSAEHSNVTVGGSVEIRATVRDANGRALANQSCTLAVASQPGTGASVNPTSGKTDAKGVIEAEVSVGSTPGFVVVRVTCGSVAGSITLVAGGVEKEAETPEIGQAPESGIELPSTGGGSDSGSNGLGLRIGAGAAIVLLLAGAQAVRTYRRRRA